MIALIGGGLLSGSTLGIPPVTYIQRIREVVPITDLYIGLIKAPVFGAIIAIAGCFQGMQVEADAEQVGLRTTVGGGAGDLPGDRARRLLRGVLHLGGVELMAAQAATIAIIQVRGPAQRLRRPVVHDGLDLDVRRGEILGVVGGSGTGKSVLMRSIIGLQTPARGRDHRVRRADDRPRGDRGDRDPQALGRAVPGRRAVLDADRRRECPGAAARILSASCTQSLLDEIAAYKVVMTGLPADAGPKYPAELSGGMKKRAGLARALALDPELLFLDEPTAGLDPIGAAAFDELTPSLQKTLGLTVFLITHDLDTLYAICDRVAVLADKKVIAVGTIDELLALDHPWIQEYFNGPRGRAAVASAGGAARRRRDGAHADPTEVSGAGDRSSRAGRARPTNAAHRARSARRRAR